MQIPEAGAQMDGPGEATRQSAWPDFTKLPQTRGKSQDSAAVWMIQTTRFRLWSYPGLYHLLHYKYPLQCNVQGIQRRIRVSFSYFSKFLHDCIFHSCTLWRRRRLCNRRFIWNKGHFFLFSFNFCNFILFCDLSDFSSVISSGFLFLYFAIFLIK